MERNERIDGRNTREAILAAAAAEFAEKGFEGASTRAICRRAGDMIRLIFEEDGKWIALMTWAAACYRLKPRDLEIGWNRAMCAKRSRASVLSSARQKKS